MSTYGPRRGESSLQYFNNDILRKPWGRNKRELQLDDYLGSMDLVKNKDGCIRWKYIRAAYFSHLVDLNFVVNAYDEWVTSREDLWIDGYDAADQLVGTYIVAASKRGNEYYKKRLNKKFSFFEDLSPIHFFCEEWGHKTTPMLFVSLTVDPELVKNDIDQAWDVIAHEFHIFETKLRQEYGRFVKLRVWEAHGGDGKSRGFPHVHIVYYFLDRQFEVWEYYNKKKNKKGFIDEHRSWRIADKHLEKIRSFWGLCSSEPGRKLFGVDVQGVSDTLGALSEVRKYITKTIWSDASKLTVAQCCLHNKQVYRFSQCDPYPLFKELEGCSLDYVLDRLRPYAAKDFIGAVWGVEAYYKFYRKLHKAGVDEGLAEPGLSALVMTAVHNCNNEHPEIVKFVFRGAYLHADIVRFWPKISDEEVTFDKPPDDVRLLLGVDREYVSWSSAGSRRSFSGSSEIDTWEDFDG